MFQPQVRGEFNLQNQFFLASATQPQLVAQGNTSAPINGQPINANIGSLVLIQNNCGTQIGGNGSLNQLQSAVNQNQFNQIQSEYTSAFVIDNQQRFNDCQLQGGQLIQQQNQMLLAPNQLNFLPQNTNNYQLQNQFNALSTQNPTFAQNLNQSNDIAQLDQVKLTQVLRLQDNFLKNQPIHHQQANNYPQSFQMNNPHFAQFYYQINHSSEAARVPTLPPTVQNMTEEKMSSFSAQNHLKVAESALTGAAPIYFEGKNAHSQHFAQNFQLDEESIKQTVSTQRCTEKVKQNINEFVLIQNSEQKQSGDFKIFSQQQRITLNHVDPKMNYDITDYGLKKHILPNNRFETCSKISGIRYNSNNQFDNSQNLKAKNWISAESELNKFNVPREQSGFLPYKRHKVQAHLLPAGTNSPVKQNLFGPIDQEKINEIQNQQLLNSNNILDPEASNALKIQLKQEIMDKDSESIDQERGEISHVNNPELKQVLAPSIQITQQNMNNQMRIDQIIYHPQVTAEQLQFGQNQLYSNSPAAQPQQATTKSDETNDRRQGNQQLISPEQDNSSAKKILQHQTFSMANANFSHHYQEITCDVHDQGVLIDKGNFTQNFSTEREDFYEDSKLEKKSRFQYRINSTYQINKSDNQVNSFNKASGSPDSNDHHLLHNELSKSEQIDHQMQGDHYDLQKKFNNKNSQTILKNQMDYENQKMYQQFENYDFIDQTKLAEILNEDCIKIKSDDHHHSKDEKSQYLKNLIKEDENSSQSKGSLNYMPKYNQLYLQTVFEQRQESKKCLPAQNVQAKDISLQRHHLRIIYFHQPESSLVQLTKNFEPFNEHQQQISEECHVPQLTAQDKQVTSDALSYLIGSNSYIQQPQNLNIKLLVQKAVTSISNRHQSIIDDEQYSKMCESAQILQSEANISQPNNLDCDIKKVEFEGSKFESQIQKLQTQAKTIAIKQSVDQTSAKLNESDRLKFDIKSQKICDETSLKIQLPQLPSLTQMINDKSFKHQIFEKECFTDENLSQQLVGDSNYVNTQGGTVSSIVIKHHHPTGIEKVGSEKLASTHLGEQFLKQILTSKNQCVNATKEALNEKENPIEQRIQCGVRRIQKNNVSRLLLSDDLHNQALSASIIDHTPAPSHYIGQLVPDCTATPSQQISTSLLENKGHFLNLQSQSNFGKKVPSSIEKHLNFTNLADHMNQTSKEEERKGKGSQLKLRGEYSITYGESMLQGQDQRYVQNAQQIKNEQQQIMQKAQVISNFQNITLPHQLNEMQYHQCQLYSSTNINGQINLVTSQNNQQTLRDYNQQKSLGNLQTSILDQQNFAQRVTVAPQNAQQTFFLPYEQIQFNTNSLNSSQMRAMQSTFAIINNNNLSTNQSNTLNTFKLARLTNLTLRYEVIYKNLLRDLRKFFIQELIKSTPYSQKKRRNEDGFFQACIREYLQLKQVAGAGPLKAEHMNVTIYDLEFCLGALISPKEMLKIEAPEFVNLACDQLRSGFQVRHDMQAQKVIRVYQYLYRFSIERLKDLIFDAPFVKLFQYYYFNYAQRRFATSSTLKKYRDAYIEASDKIANFEYFSKLPMNHSSFTNQGFITSKIQDGQYAHHATQIIQEENQKSMKTRTTQQMENLQGIARQIMGLNAGISKMEADMSDDLPSDQEGQ